MAKKGSVAEETLAAALASKAKGKGKKKNGNKRSMNSDRKARKYGRMKSAPQQGKCGSQYCTKGTGCQPWK